MSALLEDFGHPATRRAAETPAPAEPEGRYDDGYNAGWEDAMAQVEAEQARIGAQLAERLAALGVDNADRQSALIGSLEPALREVFDKILPHAVERGFHAILVEEITRALETANAQLTILVSPEDVAALSRLLQRAGIAEDLAVVAAEPALAMSQALVRWTGQERRIDLDGVLTDLDTALDTYFATLDRGQNVPEAKEA